MASSAATLDSVITVKVNFENTTRRVKMPLRDTTPQLLEKQIRAFLHIPADREIDIERFSDSAGSYILLDANNAAVYKQLYRAAKAKSKLKLRVTGKDAEEAVVPKPVTVEDMPEGNVTGDASSTLSGCPTIQENDMLPSPSSTNPLEAQEAPEVATEFPTSHLSKFYEPALLKQAAKLADPIEIRRKMDSIASKEQDPLKESQMAAMRSADALNALFHTNNTGFECARFAICCNSCERTTPDVHYHCSTCEDGDFDLCQSCVDQGITCHSGDHWLIKRTTTNGQIITSTTETIAPKPKEKEEFHPEFPSAEAKAALARLEQTMSRLNLNMRTCNCCVEERPEADFVHCQNCDDYDLCQPCFARDAHGHHPFHGFEPAVPGTVLPEHIRLKLEPGRNKVHHAICDNCDKFITGVRHKCLECPDWDYCAECMLLADMKHPKHRFVPIFEPLQLAYATDCPAAKPAHYGICCDGPLCVAGTSQSYIRGVRYKCAVCNDIDFCANCEASPDNKHNKTHPLIKFKTPVRHVSVTTTGEHSDGQRMPAMGDRAHTTPTPSMNAVRTVVDMKPQEPAPITPITPVVKEVKKEPVSEPVAQVSSANDLRAVFVRDHVPDGTILPANHVFEQTWVLRNEGNVSWPAGCSVKFVSGDYMGHVDSNHPAGISELVSASESTICYEPLAPGKEFPFTVLLRTPNRVGKHISYWRLTSPDGIKFGHRLWCDVSVRVLNSTEPSPVAPVVPSEKKEEKVEDPQVNSSQMVFPKLEKESPESSVHAGQNAAPVQVADKPTVSDDFDEFGHDDEWDASDDGFMTDEEYDILDASDEEFLEEQQKKQLKK